MIILIVPNEEKEGWHYLVIKKLLILVTNNIYCLHYLHSFRIENELKSHESVSKNKHFCGILLANELKSHKRVCKNKHCLRNSIGFPK